MKRGRVSKLLFSFGLGVSLLGISAPVAVGNEPASSHTVEHNVKFAATLPPSDEKEWDFAQRGFIATRPQTKILGADGHVVWDLDHYAWVKGPAPASVNPSLWKRAKLLGIHGLFRINEKVHQVRGFDVSNMTIIEGETGFILIDPLFYTETAAAAMELVRKYVGDKPIKAIIYTHPHADHFGGAGGIITQADADSGRVEIIAPDRFNEELFSENVMVGNATIRRALLQTGVTLETGPAGEVSVGNAPVIGDGTVSLIPPTRLIKQPLESLVIDGVEIEFQLTPNTESPAEMNIFFPQLRTLCLAENASATLHNVLTPRGAPVRDAKAWSGYLDQALKLFGDRSDYLVAVHTWPRYGREEIKQFVADQSDLYKYIHDQSVRMTNAGLVPSEIAEQIKLPAALDRQWYSRSYYGSLKFNAKAVYQRYLGWYDANPANLDPLPPATTGKRYVAAIGGSERVLRLGKDAFDRGDYRWAAQLLNNLVMADPTNTEARALLGSTYTQMAYQSENGPWRNIYLTAAQELRDGPTPSDISGVATSMAEDIPTEYLFDLLAVRIDPAKAKEEPLAVRVIFPERNEDFVVTVRNDVLRNELFDGQEFSAKLTMPRQSFLSILKPSGGLAGLASAKIEGNRGDVERLFSIFTAPDPNFPIITRPH